MVDALEEHGHIHAREYDYVDDSSNGLVVLIGLLFRISCCLHDRTLSLSLG